jgi:dTDP-4-dehydrorhamnose reductase
MRVVLIGASGQLGCEFCKLIPNKNLLPLSSKLVDVRNISSISKLFNRGKDYDVIINLSAFHNSDDCEEFPEQAFAVNSVGALNVAKIARSYNLPVVYFSTDYVFGGDNHHGSDPYIESDVVFPVNNYGTSKVAGEYLVRSVTENHLIIRTSSLFGTTTSKKGHTFPEMVIDRAGHRLPIKIVDDQYISPTHAMELAQKTMELLSVNARGTFHITGGGGCSWFEFARETLRYMNLDNTVSPCKSSDYPSKANRPSFTVLDSERLQLFGVAPMKPWQKGLKNYLSDKKLLKY